MRWCWRVNYKSVWWAIIIRYAFHYAVQDIVHFCADEMGAFYLDILKDRLYTMKADSRGRRSAQTALYHISRSLILGISPILCFTAEEAWKSWQAATDSVLYHTLHEFPSMPETWKRNWRKMASRA